MNTLPELYPGQVCLILAPRSMRQWMSALLARLALAGPVRVLDGGNCFQAYPLARALREQTEQPEVILGRVHVARAFTCYQVSTLLAVTPSLPVPTLALDLLSTFGDESVPLVERRRLLEESLAHLRRLSRQGSVAAHASSPGASLLEESLAHLTRLSRQGPVAVHASSPAASTPAEFLERLEAAASQVWRLEPPPSRPLLRLFP